MNPQIINIAYIVSAVIFILGIKMLGKAETARKGNILSSVGMLVAVVFTLFDHKILDATDKITWAILSGGLLLGALAGWIAAKKVKMTSMPEMVALLNGFGGLASLLVAWAEYHYDGVSHAAVGGFSRFAIIATILIGGVTFTGSAYAWAKLSGKISGKPAIYAGQKIVNAAVALLALAFSAAFAIVGDYHTGYEMMAAAIAMSLVLGIVAVMPIGGGDMPGRHLAAQFALRPGGMRGGLRDTKQRAHRRRIPRRRQRRNPHRHNVQIDEQNALQCPVLGLRLRRGRL